MFNHSAGTGNPTTYPGKTFAFNADNQIIGNGKTYFLYDGSSPVCEMSGTGAIVTVNTWGGLVVRISMNQKEPRHSARLVMLFN